ncbi:MAG: tRNA pseudouridine(55) synthase TruB [Legionella sp.]|nr:MAG: tRNA pseudouridine(55) synthase TruB [Legionella sp.]
MTTPKQTNPKADINGILLIDKPGLLSSNTVLQHAKRLYNARKAGHMGSLDPLATGMLPVCFGEATKFAQQGLEADKCYAVTALFGITTNTGDAQGDILTTTAELHLSQDIILHALSQFLGDSLQTPPMFSALKHQGKKLYEFARVGIEIERQPRPVTIHHFELLQLDAPYAQFLVRCSKGTYIRTLIEDLGHALDCGAHVTQLRRVYTTGFEHQPMYSLDELQLLSVSERMACLLPVDHMLHHMPIITLDAYAIQQVYQGRVVTIRSQVPSGQVRIYDEQHQFQGLADYDQSSELLQPKRLMANDQC